jgi:hypothetical protein
VKTLARKQTDSRGCGPDPHQLAHVHGRRVVKALSGGAEQERVRVQLLFLLGGELGKHLQFGRFKDAIESPEHRKRQDDLAIVGLLVVTAKQVRD